MLHVHRSDRADGLIAALRDLLADPPADPFAREVVAVPTRGMERWLTQRLVRTSLGICANVDFPFPRRLTGDAVAAASGIEPESDPWLPERLVWPLLDVVDECAGRAVAAVAGGGADDQPGAALRRGPPPRASCSTATRCTGRTGARVGVRGRRALAGRAVAAAATTGSPSPIRRRGSSMPARGCAPSRTWWSCRQRFSLFGLTRLPAGQLNVLRALAEHRDVHLFLLHPSPALWARIARRAEGHTSRGRRDGAAGRDNRLLASWGQDSRELQLVIGPDAAAHEHPVEHRTRHAARPAPGGRAGGPAARARATTDAQHPGPRVPRPRAPGRGRARRDPAPAASPTRRSSRAT